MLVSALRKTVRVLSDPSDDEPFEPLWLQPARASPTAATAAREAIRRGLFTGFSCERKGFGCVVPSVARTNGVTLTRPLICGVASRGGFI